MTRKQMVGSEHSATRTTLLDAAEILMQEEGYAAVTSRRLGAKADVRPQLVHYYFPSMDDLFIALFRRRAELGLKFAAEALSGERPLQVLWAQNTDPANATLNLEFTALANHRKVLRAEFAHYGEQLRRLQHQALARHFKSTGIKPDLDPQVLTFLMAAVGILLAMENEMGMSFAHPKVLATVESTLKRLTTKTPRRPVKAARKRVRPKRSAGSRTS